MLSWGGVWVQKALDKFGHVHKQAAKGVGMDTASSIPNPRVGAGSGREHPTEDGLMLSGSCAVKQKAELEGTLV